MILVFPLFFSTLPLLSRSSIEQFSRCFNLVQMRSVPLLVLYGACLGQGLSLERRDLHSEDSANKFESDLVERNDEFFVAQHLLARPDDTLALDEKKAIDPNLNPVDHLIDPIEPLIEQKLISEDHHSDVQVPSILKRVPDFITFTERFFTRVLVTRLVSYRISFTEGTPSFVTVTDKNTEPQIVTSYSFIPVTTTVVFTEGGPVYQITAPPAGATEEFLTSAYVAETLLSTFTVQRGIPERVTVTRPPTVTITERLSTVTVTETYTIPRRIPQTITLPVVTRPIVLPGCCACPVPTTTTG